MKWNITNKELSLLLGIMVALIIVITLWLSPASNEAKNVSIKVLPAIPAKVSKVVAEKVLVTLDQLLR